MESNVLQRGSRVDPVSESADVTPGGVIMPWIAGLAVRVVTHKQAHVDQRFIVDALKEIAYRRGLAGVTILRADEGRSDHRRLHTAATLKVAGAPVVVEFVDRADRIEPLLPEIAGLITSGVLVVADIRLYFPATRLQARDVMSPAPTLAADAPAATALAMRRGETRLIPVVAPSVSRTTAFWLLLTLLEARGLFRRYDTRRADATGQNSLDRTSDASAA